MANPRPVLIGLAGHYVVFPALTFALVLIIRPAPSIALGHDAHRELSGRQHLQLSRLSRARQHRALGEHQLGVHGARRS